MDRFGHIEIHVEGKIGGTPITPSNYDIGEIRMILENVENMLYPSNKKDRPIITYQIGEGSVRHKFIASIQAVVAFTAVASMVHSEQSINGLDAATAKAFENMQNISKNKHYSFDISTSESNGILLKITPDTKFEKSENIWVETELYFYGMLTNAGGKQNPNIHLDTKDYGMLLIYTEREFLKETQDNLLYREYGVRVIGKQNIETKQIDRTTLKLIELTGYNPKFDEEYLNKLILKASPKFKGVDTNAWLSEIRGVV